MGLLSRWWSFKFPWGVVSALRDYVIPEGGFAITKVEITFLKDPINLLICKLQFLNICPDNFIASWNQLCKSLSSIWAIRSFITWFNKEELVLLKQVSSLDEAAYPCGCGAAIKIPQTGIKGGLNNTIYSLAVWRLEVWDQGVSVVLWKLFSWLSDGYLTVPSHVERETERDLWSLPFFFLKNTSSFRSRLHPSNLT